MSLQLGFGQPHDIAVSSDGETVYVGEIGPNRVWKFTRHKGELVELGEEEQSITTQMCQVLN